MSVSDVSITMVFDKQCMQMGIKIEYAKMISTLNILSNVSFSDFDEQWWTLLAKKKYRSRLHLASSRKEDEYFSSLRAHQLHSWEIDS